MVKKIVSLYLKSYIFGQSLHFVVCPICFAEIQPGALHPLWSDRGWWLLLEPVDFIPSYSLDLTRNVFSSA